MDDWKERLKAEYVQTKERCEKLKAWNEQKAAQAYAFALLISQVSICFFLRRYSVGVMPTIFLNWCIK